jgi:hypothetical protein
VGSIIFFDEKISFSILFLIQCMSPCMAFHCNICLLSGSVMSLCKKEDPEVSILVASWVPLYIYRSVNRPAI